MRPAGGSQPQTLKFCAIIVDGLGAWRRIPRVPVTFGCACGFSKRSCARQLAWAADLPSPNHCRLRATRAIGACGLLPPFEDEARSCAAPIRSTLRRHLERRMQSSPQRGRLGRTLNLERFNAAPTEQCSEVRIGGFDKGLLALVTHGFDSDTRALLSKREFHGYNWKLLQKSFFAWR